MTTFNRNALAVVVALSLSNSAAAFQLPSAGRTLVNTSPFPLYSAVAPPQDAAVVDDIEKMTEKAQGKAPPEGPLHVRIHGEWFDLTGWRAAHPAGTHWIDYYAGRDATEVMDAFHSEKGRSMYKRLPKVKEDTAVMLDAIATPDSDIQMAFRKLRDDLEKDGWYERDMVHEFTQLGLWASCVVAAAATASSVPILSTGFLAMSMTAAGWLGHDYIHGVDKFANTMRSFSALAAGLAPTWWSDKHNKHHALTNEMGVDEDIATDPFLYQWAPDPANDSPLRKIQHLIFYIPFSFMFALWRLDSVKVGIEAIEQKRPDAKKEVYSLLIHYAVLLSVFPVNVWLPAIFVSGLISALIVTPRINPKKCLKTTNLTGLPHSSYPRAML